MSTPSQPLAEEALPAGAEPQSVSAPMGYRTPRTSSAVSLAPPPPVESNSATDDHEPANLFQAMVFERTDKIDEFLSPSSNSFILHIKLKDALGRTPLYFAAQYGRKALVDRIIQTAAANVDETDNEGWSPLFIASLNGFDQIVSCLLEHGASVDKVDKQFGWTPLFAALSRGHKEVVSILLKNNASMKVRDHLGRTPLWLASSLGLTELVDLLLGKANVDINAVDEKNRSPLYAAVQSNHLEVVKLLVTHNCDIEFADVYQRSPLLLAERLDHLEIADFLLSRGAHKIPEGKLGRSPSMVDMKGDSSPSSPTSSPRAAKIRGRFIAHRKPPQSMTKLMCLASENNRIWAAGSDGSITIWDAKSMELLHFIEKAHPSLIHDIVGIPALGCVWTLSENVELKIWKWKGSTASEPALGKFDPAAVELVTTQSFASQLFCFEVSGDNIWAGSSDGTVYHWTLSSFEFGTRSRIPLPFTLNTIPSAAELQKSAPASSDKRDQTPFRRKTGEDPSPANTAPASNDSLTGSTSRGGETPHRTSVSAPRDLLFFDTPPPAPLNKASSASSLYGNDRGSLPNITKILVANRMLFAVAKNTVYCYDEKILTGPFEKHAFKGKLEGHIDDITALIYLGNKLVTASRDSTLRSWELNTFSNLYVRENPHSNPPSSLVRISDDVLVSSGFDKKVKVWDSSLFLLLEIDVSQKHQREISSLMWDKDSRKLWVSSMDKSVSIWS